MNNYQSKVLELIAEYESYEWGDGDLSYPSSNRLEEAITKTLEAEVIQ